VGAQPDKPRRESVALEADNVGTIQRAGDKSKSRGERCGPWLAEGKLTRNETVNKRKRLGSANTFTCNASA